jgi:prepilin-type N-terminal cleavage/methylation domain-containing protein
MPRQRASSGFTLIELMVVIAILGIVMSFGVPAMRDLLANQRMKSAGFDMVVAAMFARSEAVTRGIPIYIAAPSGNLTQGWCVQLVPSSSVACVPLNPNLNVTMRVQKPATGVSYSFVSGAAPVTFNRSGRLASQVRIEIVDTELAALKRCVTIDVGGNARSAVGACS